MSDVPMSIVDADDIVFSPEMAGLRKVVLKILGPALVLIILVMWACLPLYWGSRTYPSAPSCREVNHMRLVIWDMEEC